MLLRCSLLPAAACSQLFIPGQHCARLRPSLCISKATFAPLAKQLQMSFTVGAVVRLLQLLPLRCSPCLPKDHQTVLAAPADGELTVDPVCLMMMPPAFTGCPPNTFTPRLFDSESRPFFVLPAPFLCAASIVSGARATTLLRLKLLPASALHLKLDANMVLVCIAATAAAVTAELCRAQDKSPHEAACQQRTLMG